MARSGVWRQNPKKLRTIERQFLFLSRHIIRAAYRYPPQLPLIVLACLPAGQFDHVSNEDILLPFIGLFAFLNSLILDIFLESYHKRVTVAVPSVSSGQRKYRETLSGFLFDFGTQRILFVPTSEYSFLRKQFNLPFFVPSLAH